MDAITGCLGPLARSARDLGLFCRVMDQYKPWRLEAGLFEIPWRSDIEEGRTLPLKLCFAILWDDGVASPESAITEALVKCKNALLKAGHATIDWEPVQTKQAWEIIVSE
jgi:amidase